MSIPDLYWGHCKVGHVRDYRLLRGRSPCLHPVAALPFPEIRFHKKKTINCTLFFQQKPILKLAPYSGAQLANRQIERGKEEMIRENREAECRHDWNTGGLQRVWAVEEHCLASLMSWFSRHSWYVWREQCKTASCKSLWHSQSHWGSAPSHLPVVTRAPWCTQSSPLQLIDGWVQSFCYTVNEWMRQYVSTWVG